MSTATSPATHRERPDGGAPATLLRIVGIIAWVVFLFAMLSLPDTLLTLVGALAGTVLAGWLIARWWALLVPVAFGVFWLIASVTFQAGENGDAQPIFYGLLSLFASLALAAVMAVGIGIAKLRARRR